MAEMPALVQEADSISKNNKSHEFETRRVECLKESWKILAALNNFYVELEKRSSKLLFSESPAVPFCADLDNVFPVSLHFPTFEIARTHLFYWVAILWGHNNISILRESVPSLLQDSFVIATRIAQSVEYLLSPQMHRRGPQNIFNPLRLAQHIFSKKETDGKEVKWCQRVFDEVAARGYPFGKILSNCEWEDIPMLLTRGERRSSTNE